jgi:hypothetical protein
MKFLITMLMIFSTSTSFAMSEDEVGECIVTNTNNVQSVIGLYQVALQNVYGDNIEAASDVGEELLNKLNEASVVTCADVELVIAEIYVSLLKQKKSAQ